MLSAWRGDDTIEVQQKLARVQSLLEASRRVHSTIKLDEVLAGVLEIAAKELKRSVRSVRLRSRGGEREERTLWIRSDSQAHYKIRCRDRCSSEVLGPE